MGYNLEDGAARILNNAAEDKCTCASSVTPANWPFERESKLAGSPR